MVHNLADNDGADLGGSITAIGCVVVHCDEVHVVAGLCALGVPAEADAILGGFEIFFYAVTACEHASRAGRQIYGLAMLT